MSMPKLSPAQQEALIQSLAAQLHCDPNTLRKQLQSGNYSVIVAMGGSDSRQLQQLLRDPKQLQQVMNSPEMKELLRRIQQK